MKNTFIERAQQAIDQSDSLLCVGLDTDINRLPHVIKNSDNPLFEFNKRIIDATLDYVSAYKLNLAFYEVYGTKGWDACIQTLKYIPQDKIKIADAKRGDIGNTAAMYADSVFDNLGADAITVNPYMGYDAAAPFLKRPEYGVFFLCLTSNKGAKEFQTFSDGTQTLFIKIAKAVKTWNTHNNCGLVVGATHPEDMGRVRDIAPNLPFLIPGIGAQGGNIEQAVQYGTDDQASLAFFNSSRSIIYASASDDFDQAARQSAQKSFEQLNTARKTKCGEKQI